MRRTLASIIGARIIRAGAYGALSVSFALLLAQRGVAPFVIGALLAAALVAGAAFSAVTGILVRRFGQRVTLTLAAFLMLVAGALLASSSNVGITLVAALLGTLSVGGQEVGPFGAIEQHLLAQLGDQKSAMRRFSMYNLLGALALAGGALAAASVLPPVVPWLYAGAGALLVGTYAQLGPLPGLAPPEPCPALLPQRRGRLGVTETLTLLYGVDALAGGFVVQSFLALWLHVRFGVAERQLGVLFFATNLLAGLSYLAAERLARRIGLLRTMVFTHLPSNVLLSLVPLMPTFELAAVVLLLRFSLSQMDVPTRQAFTLYAVEPDKRARAAGLTNAVRPAAAAISPIFSGLALQTLAMGLPFFIAGGLKIAYDLAMLGLFSRLKLKTE